MGATLVVKVATRWGKRLSPNGFRALTVMAVTALDNPTPDVPACLYFAGHDLLAQALKDSDIRTKGALEKAVQEAIKEIIALGAAELVQRAKAKGRAIYRLTLDNKPGIYQRDLRKLAKLLSRVETTVPPDEEPAADEFDSPGGDDGSTWMPDPGGDDVSCFGGDDGSTRGGDVVSTLSKEPLEELKEEEVLTVRTHLALPRGDPSETAPAPPERYPGPAAVPPQWPPMAAPCGPPADVAPGPPDPATATPPDTGPTWCIHGNAPSSCLPCRAARRPATTPPSQATGPPGTCPDHGRAFKAGLRPDGKPWCPLCRAAARAHPRHTQLSILELR